MGPSRLCRGSALWRLFLILLLVLGMLGSLPDPGLAQDAGTGTETPVIPSAMVPTQMVPIVEPPTSVPTENLPPTGTFVAPTVEPTTPATSPVATETEAVKPDVPEATDPATPDPTATQTPEGEDFVGSAGGTINVLVRDEQGDPVLFTCIRLWKDGGGGSQGEYVSDTCDHVDSNNNGDITVPVATVGNYVIGIPSRPIDYFPAADIAVTVAAGQTLERAIVLPPGGRFRLHAKDQDNDVLTGACF